MTNTAHVGRSWNGHTIEDHCPCPQAPCGLVPADQAREDCQHHHWAAGKSLRQGHPAADCPGAPAVTNQADAAQQDKPWLSDSARIGRALIWSWSDSGRGERGAGYRAAQQEVRALLTGQRDAAAAAPAAQGLRDRIAVVLAEADGYEYAKGLGLRDMSADTQQHYDQLADAVMSVVLAELDRVQAERDKYAAELDRLNLERWEDQPTRVVLDEIHAERLRQDEKWGEQNHPDIDPRDIDVVTRDYFRQKAEIHRAVNEERATPSRTVGRCSACPEGDHTHTAWDVVLLEEAYEALGEEDPARLRAELVQVAAVAVAWVEAIDRRPAPAEEAAR
ncbi:hypothetical protein [Streptomyces cucumeris]|uniref:hypothetical protein n=1 Tax=Streptomyces cucumeris TaxID=2962890 RepID=UPI003D760A64